MSRSAFQTRKIPSGAGKTEVAFKRLQSSDGDPEGVNRMLVLPRWTIEAGFASVIDHTLGADAPGEGLREMAGATLVTVAGYGDCDEELFEIPEVREFFRQQNERWAPWVFAGSIFTADLFAIALASLPSVVSWRRGDELHVRWREEEMTKFFLGSVRVAGCLHSRAGIGWDEGIAMLAAVAAYLGLPMD